MSHAGVCATDLALLAGYMGFRGVPGHEFVGVSTTGPLTGQRVVGEINAACGECEFCQGPIGPRHCPSRTVLGILNHGGAFAEELVLPTDNLLPVPDAVSDEAATFTEPVAAAFEILEQIQPEGRAAVVGDGRLGLICALVLSDHCEVEVIGRHPERAALFDGKLRWVTPPEGARYDLLVEATGRPQMIQEVLSWVRPRGTVVLKTTAERPAPLDLSLLVVNELTLLGSRCGPFAPALEWLSVHGGLVERMVEERLPLDRAEEAMALARGRLKVLVDVRSPG